LLVFGAAALVVFDAVVDLVVFDAVATLVVFGAAFGAALAAGFDSAFGAAFLAASAAASAAACAAFSVSSLISDTVMVSSIKIRVQMIMTVTSTKLEKMTIHQYPWNLTAARIPKIRARIQNAPSSTRVATKSKRNESRVTNPLKERSNSLSNGPGTFGAAG